MVLTLLLYVAVLKLISFTDRSVSEGRHRDHTKVAVFHCLIGS